MNDPYSILGVARDATEDQIKAAYRKMAMKYHPDRNPNNPDAESKFKEVSAAYEDIKNPKRHQQQQQHPGFGGFPPGFESYSFSFGGGPGGGAFSFEEILRNFHNQSGPRNRNYNTQCAISLEDAFRGCEVNLKINEREMRMKIPAGVASGNRVHVVGAGENIHPNQPPGDLYVQVEVRPHPQFTRNGDNLICNVEMDFIDAMLGERVSVNTLDGDNVSFEIPAGIQSGHRFRLEKRGMPLVNSPDRGDLFVILNLKMPQKFSDQQIELLKQIKELANAQDGNTFTLNDV